MIVVINNGNPDAVVAPLDKPLNAKDVPGIVGMASHRSKKV